MAELAFNADPSAENKAAVQQARAKACAASAKLGRSEGAALSAEEGGKGKASAEAREYPATCSAFLRKIVRSN